MKPKEEGDPRKEVAPEDTSKVNTAAMSTEDAESDTGFISVSEIIKKGRPAPSEGFATIEEEIAAEDGEQEAWVRENYDEAAERAYIKEADR